MASLAIALDDEIEAAWDEEIERRTRAALADPDGGEDWATARDDMRDELAKAPACSL